MLKFSRFFVLVMLVVAAGGLAVVVAQEATDEPEEREIEQTEAPEWDGTHRRIDVPILMYHYISDPPGGSDEYRIDLSISPGTFRGHLQYLFDNGYTPISLYDLDEALLTGRALPLKPVILTFDDGYIDHYTNAFTILQEIGFAGTFFIITARADAGDPNHLNWEQIREMADAGMSMESHTKNHPNLQGRDEDYLVYEMLGSIESLNFYTGKTRHMFCYPGGDFDAMTLQVAARLPIWRAVTTENGRIHTTDNRLLLPRIRISNGMGVAALASLLEDD